MTRKTLNTEAAEILRELMAELDMPWRFDYESQPLHTVFDYAHGSESKRYRCTAAVVDRALRLTVQSLLAGDGSLARLKRLDELNAQWGIGRVYLDHSHGDFDVASGIFVGAGLPKKHLFLEMLGQLIDAGESLARLVVPRFKPKLQTTRILDAAGIHQVLSSQGLQSTLRDDKEVVGLRLAIPVEARRTSEPAPHLMRGRAALSELDFVMEFQVDQNQLLRISVLESNPIGVLEDESIYHRLQDINRGLSFGTMIFDSSNGRFVYIMTLALGWFTFNADLARWLVQRAVSVMTELNEEGYVSCD